MTEQELITKIEETLRAIEEYKKTNRQLTNSIVKYAELVQRAFFLGPAGQKCPTCGGSGRV